MKIAKQSEVAVCAIRTTSPIPLVSNNIPIIKKPVNQFFIK